MTLSGYSDWEKSVLESAGVSHLSDIESPVEGSTGTYPLLVSEGEATGFECAHFDWRVRVVVNDAVDTYDVLRDSDTEILGAQELDEQPLSSLLQAGRTATEGRVRVDLNLLRNITEIRRLQDQSPDIDTWVLVSEGQADQDPEALVGETLRQLTGVLSGCQVLEIRQGIGESVQSLRIRLNIARLMAHESSLRGLPDPISGAGFFEELAQRL